MEIKKYQHWETSPTVNELVSLTRFTSRYKWIFILLCVVVFSVSFYVYHTHTYYSSRVTFLVNSSSMAEILWDRSNDGPVEMVNDDRGYNRINQIIYSSQMINFLIDKFDLYKHYRISRESPDGYLFVSSILKKHMSVGIGKTKIITVQISDRQDYNVAADMANAIGNKINDINRQITLENLSRKTEMFETLGKDLREKSKREFSQMDSLMKNMQLYLNTAVHDPGYRQLISMNIESLQSKSEDYFKDMFESYKYRLYSMYSMQEKNLPTISVLEKAIPDRYSKSASNKYVYPLLIVFSFLVPLMFAYIVMKAAPLVRFVFVKSAERKRLGQG